MIAAVSKKITELEAKIESHGQSIQDLVLQKVKEKKDENGEKEREIPDPGEVQGILLSFQGELKDQRFMVNTLQSRFFCQQEEIRVLRSYVQEKISKEEEIESLKNIVHELCATSTRLGNKKENVEKANSISQNLSGEEMTLPIESNSEENSVKLNPEVPEFKPRNSQHTVARPVTSTNTNTGTGTTTISTPNGNASATCTAKNVTPNRRKNKEDNVNYIRVKSDCLIGEKSAISLTAPQQGLPDLEVELQEGNFSLERMQQKLFEKNRVILEAERRLEEALTREAEVAQRSAWTEHKICLLKQDKHRRGETIGKLLRCIDSISDLGCLDLAKATSERAILTTTLSTRCMPHEERIQVAINVTEAERLHQYCPDQNSPRYGPDGMDKPAASCEVMMPHSPAGSAGSSIYDATFVNSPPDMRQP